MIFQGEDTKVTIDIFRGLYSRGSEDEVPTDHARECVNMVLTSDGHVRTRDGIIKSITLPGSKGIRRFFVMSGIPENIGQPPSHDPGASDGADLLWLSNDGKLYIGNNTTPKLDIGGVADFSALNIANRTYVSPNTGQGGLLKGKLQIVNSFTGAVREAGGHAPEQISGTTMVATVSATTGNVPIGLHKIAVIYETETNFWTPPGPKLIYSAYPVAGNPTVFNCPSHGMTTGASARMAQAGSWGAPFSFQDTWHIKKVDDNKFSVPVDSSGFGAPTGEFFVAAQFFPATVVADGEHAIDIGSIPVGPSYVKRRIILATRADEEEFFFVPNVPGSVSELNDNTTTSTTINFDDTDLVDSADYLFDIMEAVPAGSSMCKYRNRLIITGPFIPGLQERVLVSNIGDFETFNFVNGYIQVQSERDYNDVMSCYVLRDTLYLAKFVGTFSTEDNGNYPSTWAVSVVDGTIGNYAHGVSNFTETQASPDTGDIIVVASRSGLYLFDGVMRRPELSWKIESIWKRISKDQFYRVTVAHDPWNHRLYISVPLDGALEPTDLLVCDYSDGRTADKVRWSQFKFFNNPSCIGMVYFGSSESESAYTLKIGSIDSQVLYSLKDGVTNDNGSPIISKYSPGPVYLGGVGCFKLLHFRAKGRGRLHMNVSGLDESLSVAPQYMNLLPSPGREYDRQINFTNEKLFLQLWSGDTLDDKVLIDRIDIWGLQLWPIRPSV